MKNVALFVAAILFSSCSVERETTYFAPPAITAPSPVPTADPVPVPAGGMAVVSGPSGCFSMATQPDVLTWTIHNVPLTAHIEKAYAHDEEPTCEPTTADLRTQNDHLRWARDGSTVTVWFDRATYGCGRTQIDLTIDGQTLIGVVGYYGTVCLPPPPPPPPVVPPPPPPVPLPPVPPPVHPPVVTPPPVPPPCPTTGSKPCPTPPPPKPCKKGGDDKKPCK